MIDSLPLDDRAMSVFERDAKIGLLATIDPDGLPHLSLITSLQAKAPDRLMFGQFCEGRSKDHLLANPRSAFLVMNENKELWRGQTRWIGKQGSGEDYELYNRKPMFRYNSYFGIHTVHYLDLVRFRGAERLAMLPVAAGTFAASVLGRFAGRGEVSPVLKPWAARLVSQTSTLKFMVWVAEDSFPIIVPVIPSIAVQARRIVFVPSVYRDELNAILPGTSVAVFALNLQMESVLVRGEFTGYRRYAGIKAGAIEIDWVYNSMPPKPGPIYPVHTVTPIETF
jgi:hypothetical protein